MRQVNSQLRMKSEDNPQRLPSMLIGSQSETMQQGPFLAWREMLADLKQENAQ